MAQVSLLLLLLLPPLLHSKQVVLSLSPAGLHLQPGTELAQDQSSSRTTPLELIPATAAGW
jgi:hypothetical protein